MTRFVLMLVAVLAVAGCGKSSQETKTDDTSGKATSEPEQPTGKKVTLPSGVEYQELEIGDGDVVAAGDRVVAHATGTLTDGTKFWSSHDGADKPIPFTLINPGGVIQGWVDGVPGMKVGGKRKLWIPAKLGYGARGKGPIPPNSDLVFVVEIVSIVPKK